MTTKDISLREFIKRAPSVEDIHSAMVQGVRVTIREEELLQLAYFVT